MQPLKRSDILIVDDLPEKHLVYQAILGDLGQNLINVSSGEEALKEVLERDFAVILLDVNMPGMSGYEVATLLRQRRRTRRVPIIFITAFADEAQTEQGYALGAVDYIRTPIVPEILKSKIRVFVELDQMRAELTDAQVLLEARVAERTAELTEAAAALKDEVADRQRAEERLSVLVCELNHRVKNILAVVRSIVGRTLNNKRSVSEASQIVMGRINSLGRAHEMLTEAFWSGAALNDIVGGELAGFSDRVKCDGPPINLTASAVQTFALLVHELCTNAAKYGSLSADSGEVSINWKVEHHGSEEFLKFEWRETGGPFVEPNESRGFGMSLINSMGRSLDSEPAVKFEREGLVCSMHIPMANIRQRESSVEKEFAERAVG